jgi:hypothetical protein
LQGYDGRLVSAVADKPHYLRGLPDADIPYGPRILDPNAPGDIFEKDQIRWRIVENETPSQAYGCIRRSTAQRPDLANRGDLPAVAFRSTTARQKDPQYASQHPAERERSRLYWIHSLSQPSIGVFAGKI